MRLKNHIALRFLSDKDLWWEIIETTHPELSRYLANPAEMPDDLSDKITYLFNQLSVANNKNFFITNTVLSKLEMLKVKKKERDGELRYDWTVFRDIADRKVTFIMPDNILMRVIFTGDTISFFHVTMVPDKTKENWGSLGWVMYYVNRVTGEQCSHFSHEDVSKIEHFTYALLCFMYLVENDELELAPGRKIGTQKSGKIINELPFPITIVTSRWNTTTISGAFSVRGHFAIRWVGHGRAEARLVFVEPFEKKGYVRKAPSAQV